MRRTAHHQRAYHWVKWFATLMFAATLVLVGIAIIRDGPTLPDLMIAALGLLSGGGWALMWWWPILRDRKLRRLNRCLQCEYDLKGIATNAQCPECGLVP
ncbi:MAG TPA: hypothetical protein VD997_09710 [Phycisphaerales bacterium]|nr:hypothetical protein [Phycisphaerales bacterium]